MRAVTNYLDKLAASIYYWSFGSVSRQGAELRNAEWWGRLSKSCHEAGDPWETDKIHRSIGPTTDASTGDNQDLSRTLVTYPVIVRQGQGSCCFLDCQFRSCVGRVSLHFLHPKIIVEA